MCTRVGVGLTKQGQGPYARLKMVFFEICLNFASTSNEAHKRKNTGTTLVGALHILGASCLP